MIEQKKNVSELKEGMVISKDVISEEGIFLIPSGTEINDNHILKMQLYHIDQAYILEEEPETAEVNEKELLISETPEFKTFSNQYLEHVNALESTLSKLIDVGEVSHLMLSNIVTNVVKSCNQAKLFTYLCRINTTNHETFSHSLNVSILANLFGKWLKLSNAEILTLSVAGLLHDIGKIKLDQSILNKTEPLTNEEFKHIQKHTTLGYKLISKTNVDDAIKQVVLQHHEKMDGSGYPLRPEWDTIHMYSKIISIVDIYDAITSDRPYHKKKHPFEAIRVLEEECFRVLETRYLITFLENIAYNFIGNDVELSNGEQGKIIFINHKAPSRPIVQTNKTFYDLMSDSAINIKNFI